MSRKVDSGDYGLVVYFLFSLRAIFIGLLEAVLGLDSIENDNEHLSSLGCHLI
jgi:hypothetical protein